MPIQTNLKRTPAFRHRDISTPVPIEMPELPVLPAPPVFKWMQRVLFPGIQLAVFAVGLYLIFSVIVMHSSFNLFYMIGFMALGMIASLICAVIEYFVMKKRQSRQYALLREEFIRDLQVRSGESVGVGQAYAARLERAFPGKQSAGASELTNTLWERTYDEKLLLRLGTVENAPNPAALACRQSFSKHPLAMEIAQALASCATLPRMPYLLNCTDHHCLAVTGNLAEDFSRAFLCEILENYSPERVQLHCMAEQKNLTIALLAQLPHVEHQTLNEALDVLATEDDGRLHLIWVSGKTAANAVPIVKRAAEIKTKSMIFIQNPDEAPAFCDCCIHVDTSEQAELSRAFSPEQLFRPELMSLSAFQQSLSYLSDLRTARPIQATQVQDVLKIPEKLTLFEFLKISDTRQWIFPQHPVAGSGLRIPIGQGEGGKKVFLNFTACRGHGMLAGMTGSGKSQFLLTMLTLLSLKYQPEFFTFAIIDFKADASAMQLRDLPNFVGALSDLDDSAQLNRALVMLEYESKRRQQALNDAKRDGVIAVNEIEYYHRAQVSGEKKLPPLPYLLVIVDEFVDAKRSDPNFLEQMAQIARQGRSRGIYLLLSAQNPSSEIGGQIAANMGYDICFKVRDGAISSAVIGKPVAAEIGAQQRGRGYLLTDAGGLEEFQTPYCDEELTVNGRKTTQLEEIVNLLKTRHASSLPRVFEVPLPKELLLNQETLRSLQKSPEGTDLAIPVGFSDNIYAARLEQFSIPFVNGNVMIFGNPGTGKSTLLQTMLFLGCAAYPPDKLQFIVCAFGDSTQLRLFMELPHVRNVISFEDSELLTRLPSRLEREIDIRKRTGEKSPALIVIVDRMESFDQECPRLAGRLTELSQISFKYGIYFVFSSIQHNILASNKRQSIKTWISFHTDNDPYSNYMPIREVKRPVPIPGRALACINGSHATEVHFFTVDRFGISTEENTEKLRKQIEAISHFYGQPHRAVDIETIPDYISTDAMEDCDSSILPVGLHWEYSFTPDGYHFTESPFFVVSDFVRTRDTLLYMALYSATTDNFETRQVFYCDPGVRSFPPELNAHRKLACYGENDLKQFFEEIRPLYTAPGTPANSGHIFIFINYMSLCESKAQSIGLNTHYTTFVTDVRARSSQLLSMRIHFILSDHAGVLRTDRTVSSLMMEAKQYGHGIACGGTTANRLGLETIYYNQPIPEGCGYLYCPGECPSLIKLQNRR